MEITKETHETLAKSLNGNVWKLLGNASRTEAESLLMVHTAHASQYHWLQAGTAVHEQRGEWLIYHVYATLGHGEAALRHATRCMEITENNADELKDFDLAYSHEALARANAILGNMDGAKRWKATARSLGDEIKDPEDKKIFDADFFGGEWHGVD